MKLSDFDYHLPKNRIAQYPEKERDSSRLLVIHRAQKNIEHKVFRDIIEYLSPGDVFVLNNTKVIPARFCGRKPSGGKAEALLIRELSINKWEAIIRGVKSGSVMFKHGISGAVSKFNGRAIITFAGEDIKKLIHKIGVMPLPPYINRPADESDAETYQTVYAEKEGAIAAPTAGLHFTSGLLAKIEQKGIGIVSVTLHVGFGTFRPVSSEEVEKHRMDKEYYAIPGSTATAINLAKSENRRVIAVGTTTTRALESSATGNGTIEAGAGETSIFIYPGYKFKAIDALITNFHLPKSTPMMFTSAFSGLDLLKRAYDDALTAGYRFFSYGDAMLIL